MPFIMKTTVNGQPKKIRLTDGTLYADVPIGFIIPSFETVAPLGFLKLTDTLANRTVSRTTYKELFDWATERDLIGTGKPFGVGDGSTTFVLPDSRELTTKGIGENENATAHVKSGGLAVGEFIDDRLQSHSHYDATSGQGVAQNGWATIWQDSGVGATTDMNWMEPVAGARTGDTTEVKSLGCHYYIKAKNVGVPADFVSEIDDVIGERLSYSTTEINTGKKSKDGKTIYSRVFVYNASLVAGSYTTIDSSFSIPYDKVVNAEAKAVNASLSLSLDCIWCIEGTELKVYENMTGGSFEVTITLEYTKD